MKIPRTAALTLVALAFASPALASPALVAKAKEKGFPAQNCQYCHVSKTPKKDTFKADDLNERGQFLMAEKDKQKAKAVDPEWLKGFQEKK